MSVDVLEMLADAPEGVYAVDMDHHIVFWNSGAERILGYRAEDVLGRRCYEVVRGLSEDDQEHVCKRDCGSILQARDASVAPSHTVLTRTISGEPKWISATHVLIPASRTEVSTLVHLFHDVTEEIESKHLIQRLGGLLSLKPVVSGRSSVTDGHDGTRSLSPRERDVLRLLAQGLGTDDIAERLVVNRTTVRNHIQHILAKLEVHNRLEAVVAGLRRSLL